MRRWWVVVWAVAACLMMMAPARPALAQAVTGEILSLGIGGIHSAGMYRLGQWVPVHVRLENRSGGAFDGFLAVEQNDLDGDKVLCLKPIHLEAGLEGRDSWLYYWPKPDEAGMGVPEVAVLDGQKRVITTFSVHAPMEPAGLAPENAEDNHSQRWVILLGGNRQMGLGHYIKSKGGNATTRLTWVPHAADLPDNVLGLDGVDTIIWDAEAVRVSDMAPDFQLKAILDWVRSGGHLVVTAGAQLNELSGPFYKIGEALPLKIEGTVQLPDGSIFQRFISQRMYRTPAGPFVQMTGSLKPGSRAVSTAWAMGNTGAGDHPLVVIGTYGAGTVTVVTIDPASLPANAMSPENWLAFWQKTMGWSGEIWTEARVKEQVAQDEDDREHNRGTANHIMVNPAHAKLDAAVPNGIDFSKATYQRLILAVLFLGLYWVVAGPGNFLVLRRYKLQHWSWWIFGACVVVASVGAMLVVAAFKLEKYDLKHITYVMGRSDSGDASVVAFYGIFAPKDSKVSIELPESLDASGSGANGGLTYLAPFDEPLFDGIVPFADPQQYEILNSKTTLVEVPFRSTLKKMQARWTGELTDKITTDHVGIKFASAGKGGRRLGLMGTLKNQTQYDLQDVTIVALAPNVPIELSEARIFDGGTWRHGDTLRLDMIPGRGTTPRSDDVEQILADVGKSMGRETFTKVGLGGSGMVFDPAIANAEKHKADLLNTLLELRPFEGLLESNNRVEFTRCLTRCVDRSAALRASRLLVIGYAGTAEAGVPSPLKLKVDGRELTGSGEVVFTWTIDVPETAK